MRFGFVIPNNWGFENPQDVIKIAPKAESLGYDSVWVNHHIFNTGYIQDRLGNKPYYDALTTLTYAAAMTTRVRLGTTVLVLPYLNPMVLGKAIATLDQFSGGRVILGVGVGAIEPETTAVGTDYHTRGAYSSESIRIMKELWTSDSPSYEGRFFQFSDLPFSPKPYQKPHPPIWVGGISDGALRRAARLGDGWHPIRMTPEAMSPHLEKLKGYLHTAGRDPSDLTISVRSEVRVLDSASDSDNNPLIGTPDQILRSVEAFEKLGVEEIMVQVSSPDPSDADTVMEAFAEKVMPRAR